MVITFYGTSAELIKMYGIIKAIPRDQQLLICTSQQHSGLQKVHKQLQVKPDLYLARGWKGSDVANMRQMLGLMLKVHGSFVKQFFSIKRSVNKNEAEHKSKSIVLVHGDTLTTVVGAYLGRFLGLPVAHVEAGLRSGSWKSPFPEELDRRIVSKIARLHFTPNVLAEENLTLERTKGDIVQTTYNTAKTAIEQSDKFVSENYAKLKLPKQYCLVLLHRTELLESKNDFESILKVIYEHAKGGHNVVFTTHTTTGAKIKEYNFEQYMNHKNIRMIQKQPYFDFMAIVKSASYIITDGGGLQEDSFFLGIPVVIHRGRTERQEGLGQNAVLSKMDIKVVQKFLDNPPDKSKFKKLANKTNPSEIVTSYLKSKNFYR